MDRALTWDGCCNVRDLGGLRTVDGRTTAWGEVVRSDHPDRLSNAGWAALRAHGVRTIVTLTTDGVDLGPQLLATCPVGVSNTRVAIEDATDPEFARRWAQTGLWGTPLYWADALERWPARHASAVAAVARAGRGGVLIHCGRGHDRTGLVACLLLALVGVEPEQITLDYELSDVNISPEQREAFRVGLAREQTTSRDAIVGLLASFDIERCLRRGGLTSGDLLALRARLLG